MILSFTFKSKDLVT